MPACGNCSQVCNCVISEDGFFSGHTAEGRNFTQIEGAGTEDNPYVFHFLDQELFRPRTAEIQFLDATMASRLGGDGDYASAPAISNPGGNPTGASLAYESPVHFALINVFDGTNDPNDYVAANYYLIGASVTFAETADATTNLKKIALVTKLGGLSQEYMFAGQCIPGGGGDPMTLTCETFMPGFFVFSTVLDRPFFPFALYLFQNSGSSVAVSNMKVWVTQI